MDEQLERALEDGNIDIVNQFLESDGANINCKSIEVQLLFLQFKSHPLILFQFAMFFGVE